VVNQFGFHRFEEAFGYSIIPAVTFSTHIFESIRKSTSMDK
jgi:hypothetical protein